MSLPHIVVCICTFKRPILLRSALESVCDQQSSGRFTWSVVVSDNDRGESGRAVSEDVASRSDVPVVYAVEPEQGIARARNNAVRHAAGDFVAFIDDDEFAPSGWLLALFEALQSSGAEGVLGPVDPYFEPSAPRWIVKGGFYSRPLVASGTVLGFRQCRTGNVLLKRSTLEDDVPFDPQCLSGEDQDFFRRRIAAGERFVWCHEAGVHEHVPPSRWKRGFLLRRALFRGVFAQSNHGLQPVRILQSLVAVPAYLLVLPVALLLGQARFMLCAFKLSYFTGRLLALVGFNPIRGAYVID